MSDETEVIKHRIIYDAECSRVLATLSRCAHLLLTNSDQTVVGLAEAIDEGCNALAERLVANELAHDRAMAEGGWRDIASAPKDGTLIRIAKHMGEPWGWILGTARWEGSGFLSGWVARGVGGPADGLGLASPTHWAEFAPPTPTTKEEKAP